MTQPQSIANPLNQSVLATVGTLRQPRRGMSDTVPGRKPAREPRWDHATLAMSIASAITASTDTPAAKRQASEQRQQRPNCSSGNLSAQEKQAPFT